MSALNDFLTKNGRFPPISLTIKPLDGDRQTIHLDKFLSYSFQQSMLIPVDAFSFSFKNPDLQGSFYDFIRDGDTAILEANGTTIATGRVDVVDIETTEDGGEVVQIHGRDLLGSMEDQTAVNVDSDPIYGSHVTISQAAKLLMVGTKIPGLILQDAPTLSYDLATEPGETKISALQRFLEPLNCIFWTDPKGNLKIGRPNMAQSPVTTLVMDRDHRRANVLNMKAIYASTQIPNVIIPIWTGQENVQSRIKNQAVYNAALGPSMLRAQGYILSRAVVVGTPRGADPQSLSTANQYRVAAAAGSTILQAYAKREIARANISEMTIEANVPGHYWDDLTPIVMDTVASILYPRASVDRKMYLYQATYTLDENGPRTNLLYTKLGTIVADVRAK